MNKQYPKGEGAMFVNDKKTNDKQPDFRGNVEISSAQLKELLLMAKANQAPVSYTHLTLPTIYSV